MLASFWGEEWAKEEYGEANWMLAVVKGILKEWKPRTRQYYVRFGSERDDQRLWTADEVRGHLQQRAEWAAQWAKQQSRTTKGKGREARGTGNSGGGEVARDPRTNDKQGADSADATTPRLVKQQAKSHSSGNPPCTTQVGGAQPSVCKPPEESEVQPGSGPASASGMLPASGPAGALVEGPTCATKSQTTPPPAIVVEHARKASPSAVAGTPALKGDKTPALKGNTPATEQAHTPGVRRSPRIASMHMEAAQAVNVRPQTPHLSPRSPPRQQSNLCLSVGCCRIHICNVIFYVLACTHAMLRRFMYPWPCYRVSLCPRFHPSFHHGDHVVGLVLWVSFCSHPHPLHFWPPSLALLLCPPQPFTLLHQLFPALPLSISDSLLSVIHL